MDLDAWFEEKKMPGNFSTTLFSSINQKILLENLCALLLNNSTECSSQPLQNKPIIGRFVPDSCLSDLN